MISQDRLRIHRPRFIQIKGITSLTLMMYVRRYSGLTDGPHPKFSHALTPGTCEFDLS